MSFSACAAEAPLTFSQALAYAVQHAPALQADAERIAAAEHMLTPADALPDPKLVLGVDNLPLQGEDRFSLYDDTMTMQRVGLMQEFPNRAKRKARKEAATARIDMTHANKRVTRQIILRETAQAWIARHTLEQQLAHMDSLLAENRLLEAAVRAALAGGNGMMTDIVLPRQEAAMIDARRDELQAHRQQAIAELRRWIGAQADTPLAGDVPPWPVEREELNNRLHQHPELTSFTAQARLLDAETAEARAAKQPDWAVELAYQKRGPDYDDMVSLQITLDLPLFTASRQNPMIAAKQAERDALNAEREASAREHSAMLETDFAEYQRFLNAETRFAKTLLPLADEKVTLALTAWRSSKGTLTDVITARRERINTQLEAIATRGEREQMAARLHYAYGDLSGEPL